MLQIVEQTLWRLRFSNHARVLAELALVRIAKLENLEALAEMVAEVRSGIIPTPTTAEVAKKKAELRPAPSPLTTPSSVSPVAANGHGNLGDSRRETASASVQPANAPSQAAQSPQPIVTPHALSAENALELFRQAAASLGDMTADSAAQASAAAIRAPNQLAVTFPAKYNFGKTLCERPDRTARLEQALAELVGQRVKLEFLLEATPADGPSTPPAPPRPPSARQRNAELMKNPLVRRAAELFDAHPVL